MNFSVNGCFVAGAFVAGYFVADVSSHGCFVAGGLVPGCFVAVSSINIINYERIYNFVADYPNRDILIYLRGIAHNFSL